MTYKEALELSRQAFEKAFCSRYYRALLREGMHPTEEERAGMFIRAYFAWDQTIQAYCPSIGSIRLKELQHEWRIWCDAFESGWMACAREEGI